jgi:hypothetical protein
MLSFPNFARMKLCHVAPAVCYSFSFELNTSLGHIIYPALFYRSLNEFQANRILLSIVIQRFMTASDEIDVSPCRSAHKRSMSVRQCTALLRCILFRLLNLCWPQLGANVLKFGVSLAANAANFLLVQAGVAVDPQTACVGVGLQ